MTSSLINTMTIDSLKLPFSFDGEFVLLTLSDVVKLFKIENSFKTKFDSGRVEVSHCFDGFLLE